MESAEDASHRLSSQAGGNLCVCRFFFPGVGSVTLEVSKIEVSKVILGNDTAQSMETLTGTEQVAWPRARGC